MKGRGARKGRLLIEILLSGAVKAGGGLLAFVCFVFIARSANAQEYGTFAVAFSIASLACYFIVAGQHTTVLKFLPRLGDNGSLSSEGASLVLDALVRIGAIAVAALCLSILAVFAMAGLGVADDRWTIGLVTATVGLSAFLGLAEFFSSYFRARGRILFGLWPRDILWRLLIVAVFATSIALAAPDDFRAELFSAAELGWITTGLLSVALLFQGAAITKDFRNAGTRQPLSPAIRTDVKRSYLSFWGIGLVWPARAQLGTILVGFLISAETAGAFFSAQRLSSILLMISVAINTAVGPEISRSLASGNASRTRRVFLLSCLLAGAASLAVLALFYLFGGGLLALFDESYRTYVPVLMVFALGQAVFNACGPVGVFLTLAEREKLVLYASIGATVATFAGIMIVTPEYGPIGAASVIAATTILLNIYFVSVALKALRQLDTRP